MFRRLKPIDEMCEFVCETAVKVCLERSFELEDIHIELSRRLLFGAVGI